MGQVLYSQGSVRTVGGAERTTGSKPYEPARENVVPTHRNPRIRQTSVFGPNLSDSPTVVVGKHDVGHSVSVSRKGDELKPRKKLLTC